MEEFVGSKCATGQSLVNHLDDMTLSARNGLHQKPFTMLRIVVVWLQTVRLEQLKYATRGFFILSLHKGEAPAPKFQFLVRFPMKRSEFICRRPALCAREQKAMWIAQSSVPPSSFGPISKGPSSCWKPQRNTGPRFQPNRSAHFGSSTFPPMRSTAPSARQLRLLSKRHPMRLTAHIQRRRLLRIILFGPITTLTAFPYSPPIAPTTTVLASSLKS
jgi:hypothetical protein